MVMQYNQAYRFTSEVSRHRTHSLIFNLFFPISETFSFMLCPIYILASFVPIRLVYQGHYLVLKYMHQTRRMSGNVVDFYSVFTIFRMDFGTVLMV